MTDNSKPALILAGGGARAAYQVGVLRAISNQFPGIDYPFRIIVGTSAGAINALSMAGGKGQFRHTVDHLEHTWGEVHPDQIYRADMLGLSGSMTRFLRDAVTGDPGSQGTAMLDNRPLRNFLEQLIDYEQVRASIARGAIHAVGINACNYDSGRNICFFEGHEAIHEWAHRDQRCGKRTELELTHVMASAAIPTIFPPVQIGGAYYGDGVTRQMGHLSPAIHLGASSVLAIGLSANRQVRSRNPSSIQVPNMGQIMENILNGMFVDTLDYDIERLELINQFLEVLPPEKWEALPSEYRPLPILEISPSVAIHEIARKYLKRLPGLIRRALGRHLEKGEGAASIASYLLFDRDFCRDLIALGFRDAQARARELEAFLALEPA